MTVSDMICVALAYLLGGVCCGYYLVRFKCKLDVREYGSGGVGARNVGRLLGRYGFLFTLLGDALKGALAVALARRFNASPPTVSLVLFAVIAGHIWPMPLHFRGGRGVSTAIGAYLVYNPWIALLLLGSTLVLMVFRRGFTLSGLAAFLLLPFVAFALEVPGHTVAALAACSIIIIFAHRERIRAAFSAELPPKEA